MKKVFCSFMVLSFLVNYCLPISFASIPLEDSTKTMPEYRPESREAYRTLIDTQNFLADPSQTPFEPFKTSASLSGTTEDINIVVKRDKTASVTFFSRDYAGTYDAAKSTITLSPDSISTWTLTFENNKLIGFEMKSQSTGWSSTTSYTFTDSRMSGITSSAQSTNFSYTSRSAYTFITIGDKRFTASVISEYEYSYGMPTSKVMYMGKTTTFNEYDSMARLSSTVTQGSYLVNGETQHFASYVLYDYEKHTMTSSMALGLTLSQAGSIRSAEDFRKVNYYSTLRTVSYFSDASMNWTKWTMSVYETRNTDGTFTPKMVSTKDGLRIVVGLPDALSEESDDLSLKNWQTVGGYSVYYGQGYSYENGVSKMLSFGLVFVKYETGPNGTWSQKAVVVDFPREKTVFLDKLYEIRRDDAGNISLVPLDEILDAAKGALLANIQTAKNAAQQRMNQLNEAIRKIANDLSVQITNLQTEFSEEKNTLQQVVSLLASVDVSSLSDQTRQKITGFLAEISNTNFDTMLSSYINALYQSSLSSTLQERNTVAAYLSALTQYEQRVSSAADLETLKDLENTFPKQDDVAIASIVMPENPVETIGAALEKGNTLIALLISESKQALLDSLTNEIEKMSSEIATIRGNLELAKKKLADDLASFESTAAGTVATLNTVKQSLISLRGQAGITPATKTAIDSFLAGVDEYLKTGGAWDLAKADYRLKLTMNRLLDLEIALKAREDHSSKLSTFKALVEKATTIDEINELKSGYPVFQQPLTTAKPTPVNPTPALTAKINETMYWITKAQYEIDAADVAAVRGDLLSQVNGEIGKTSADIIAAQAALNTAQNLLAADVAAFGADATTRINALNALRDTLASLGNQPGVTDATKSAINALLAGLQSYLAPTGAFETAKTEYIQKLSANRLTDLRNLLDAKQAYGIKLIDHKTEIENAATMAQLNALKTFPSYIAPTPITPSTLINPVPALAVKSAEVQTLIDRARTEISASDIATARNALLDQVNAQINTATTDVAGAQSALTAAQALLTGEIAGFNANSATKVAALSSLKDSLITLGNTPGVTAATKTAINTLVADLQTYLAANGAFETAKADYLQKLTANRLTDLSNLLQAKDTFLTSLKAHKTAVENATTLTQLNALKTLPVYTAPPSFVQKTLTNPLPALDTKSTEVQVLITRAQNDIDAANNDDPRGAYYIPKSAAEGGKDVNVIDWETSNVTGVTSYDVYRKEFGQTTWQLIHQTFEGRRFIDSNIDSSKAYYYEVRIQSPYISTQKAAHFVTPNFQGAMGVKPETVLVLINNNDYGYVDIAEQVTGFATANGKLNPITESALLAYLELPADALADGHDATWHILKDGTGKISVPLGVYYAFRRGIPKNNIVFLSNVPTGERTTMDLAAFTNNVINPIKNHMDSKGIASSINSIVSVYRFPVVAPGRVSWESQLNYSLWQAYGGGTSNTYADNSDNGRPFSRTMGDGGFLTTRIDAQDIANARRMIDDSIWSEENYHFDDAAWREQNDLKAYIDWEGPYAAGNSWFQTAATVIKNSGLFGIQGDDWDMTANIQDTAFIQKYDADGNGRLDSTLLFEGWYHYRTYQDKFDWARGAIGWSLDSNSGFTFREWEDVDNVYGNIWGANIINRGAAASLGAVYEPYLAGHTQPQLFSQYLLKGYTFAEASYFGTVQYGGPWQMAFNGDPLYTPYKISHYQGRSENIIENNQVIGKRVYEPSDSLYSPLGQLSYKDYDLAGNLVGEKLKNGAQIRHTSDGKAYYMKTGPSSGNQITMKVFNPNGSVLRSSLFSVPYSGFQMDLRVIDGKAYVYILAYGRYEVYDENGVFVKRI